MSIPIPAHTVNKLSPREVYDMLMKNIDPSLVSNALIKAKPKRESEEERAIRLSRYKKAFESYDRSYAEYVANIEQEAHMYRHQFLASAEKTSQVEEAQTLSHLESAFN
jgi:hypothetical protein